MPRGDAITVLCMEDITALILDDHEWFRRQFASLDDADGGDGLATIWTPLATRLDAHAEMEEQIFYPALLAKADEDGEETDDAIRDHNKIRDAVAESRKHDVGSDAWWTAVGQAREENDDHMAEEEREGLADFRHNATDDLRDKLGKQWLELYAQHPGGRGMDSADKDPDDYIEEHRPDGG